jgi:hypothetical protein
MALNHDQLSDHSILLRYPEVAQLAIDVLTIPASSYDSECSLIELGDLLQSRHERRQYYLLHITRILRHSLCIARYLGVGSKDNNSSPHFVEPGAPYKHA